MDEQMRMFALEQPKRETIQALDGQTWLAFTLDADVVWAQERFIERFGHKPNNVIEGARLLYVGPVEVR